MAGKTRVECEFVGVVNGVPVVVTGRGHVGPVGESDAHGSDPAVPGRQRLDIELHADVVPLGFDPALLALGGLDALMLATARSGRPDEAPFPDYPLHVHLDWKLLDENYRGMGRFEMASSIRADAGRLLVRGQFVEGRMRTEPVERVVTVGEVGSGSTVPLGADGRVLTTTYGFETDHGNGYLATAITRLTGIGEWELRDGSDARNVALERAEGRERDCRVMVVVEFCAPCR